MGNWYPAEFLICYACPSSLQLIHLAWGESQCSWLALYAIAEPASCPHLPEAGRGGLHKPSIHAAQKVRISRPLLP